MDRSVTDTQALVKFMTGRKVIHVKFKKASKSVGIYGAPAHRRAADNFCGIVMVKVVPWPTVLCTLMSP